MGEGETEDYSKENFEAARQEINEADQEITPGKTDEEILTAMRRRQEAEKRKQDLYDSAHAEARQINEEYDDFLRRRQEFQQGISQQQADLDQEEIALKEKIGWKEKKKKEYPPLKFFPRASFKEMILNLPYEYDDNKEVSDNFLTCWPDRTLRGLFSAMAVNMQEITLDDIGYLASVTHWLLQKLKPGKITRVEFSRGFVGTMTSSIINSSIYTHEDPEKFERMREELTKKVFAQESVIGSMCQIKRMFGDSEEEIARFVEDLKRNKRGPEIPEHSLKEYYINANIGSGGEYTESGFNEFVNYFRKNLIYITQVGPIKIYRDDNLDFSREDEINYCMRPTDVYYYFFREEEEENIS